MKQYILIEYRIIFLIFIITFRCLFTLTLCRITCIVYIKPVHKGHLRVAVSYPNKDHLSTKVTIVIPHG